MPNMDGVQLCKRIRAMSEIPIIVLSVRGEERNKIQALDAGADDYITKPFSSGELQARVRAALRRAPKAQTQTRESIAIGDFHIDLASRQVKVRDTEVKLTPKVVRPADLPCRTSPSCYYPPDTPGERFGAS